MNWIHWNINTYINTSLFIQTAVWVYKKNIYDQTFQPVTFHSALEAFRYVAGIQFDCTGGWCPVHLLQWDNGRFLAQTKKVSSWRKPTSLLTFWLKCQTTTQSLSRLFGLSLNFFFLPKACSETSYHRSPAASLGREQLFGIKFHSLFSQQQEQGKVWQAINWEKERSAAEWVFRPLSCLFIINLEECWLLTSSLLLCCF